MDNHCRLVRLKEKKKLVTPITGEIYGRKIYSTVYFPHNGNYYTRDRKTPYFTDKTEWLKRKVMANMLCSQGEFYIIKVSHKTIYTYLHTDNNIWHISTRQAECKENEQHRFLHIIWSALCVSGEAMFRTRFKRTEFMYYFPGESIFYGMETESLSFFPKEMKQYYGLVSCRPRQV